MSQIWIDKLRNASSDAERDEILLRDFRSARKQVFSTRDVARLLDDVEEQLRSLAALAFPR